MLNNGKKLILGIVLLLPVLAHAAGGATLLYQAPSINTSDKASLQRGARTFVNYCLSCHSAEYMRYKRVATDLGVSEETMKENLMFATDKIHEGMTVSMNADDAERWFGVLPPDLSVIARARGGKEWLFNYFMTFYRDDSKAVGVNNATFKDVAMPHVLWELQGWQEPVYDDNTGHGDEQANGEKHIVGMKLVEPGKLSPVEYRQVVRDLVNFMVYMGEPAAIKRHEIGFWVLAFLFILLLISYALKREYWKDVH